MGTKDTLSVPTHREFYKHLNGRYAATMANLNWVANNLGRPVDDIGLDEPPSYFAVKLLDWVNTDNHEDIFFRELWPRTIPSKAALETEERLRDDGRALNILDTFEKDFHANRPQGPNRESPLPPGDSPPGSRK